jgi:hypothetical protein
MGPQDEMFFGPREVESHGNDDGTCMIVHGDGCFCSVDCVGDSLGKGFLVGLAWAEQVDFVICARGCGKVAALWAWDSVDFALEDALMW